VEPLCNITNLCEESGNAIQKCCQRLKILCENQSVILLSFNLLFRIAEKVLLKQEFNVIPRYISGSDFNFDHIDKDVDQFLNSPITEKEIKNVVLK
jgi:hypothetical protein